MDDYPRDERRDEDPSPEDVARFGEASVTCRECGTELFDDVSRCWKCGEDVMATAAEGKGLPLWVVLTAVGIISLFMLGLMVRLM